MSMSPENYRQLEDRINALIKKAELFLDNKDADRRVRPMTCVEDAIALCNELSETYSECIVKGKNVKTEAIRNKYLLLAERISICRGRIMDYYKIDC